VWGINWAAKLQEKKEFLHLAAVKLKIKKTMTEAIRKTLRDSKTARWTALAVVAFTMLTGYYLTDVMAPLKPLLESQKGWSSTEYGFFTSAYGWFNVFLMMLILGGIILDKMGVRFTGLMATSIMLIGAAMKYWAISTHSLDGQVLFGWKAQVMVAALGYAIFGVGVETAGITVSKIIVKWFKGKEMALAMGLEMATARLGTTLALATSAPVAEAMNDVSVPILIALIMLCIGLISFILYVFMDKKLDASIEADNAGRPVEPEEEFKLSDISAIFINKGWWYIAILCVLFYSAVFPFIKYAADLMVNKFGVKESLAGLIPSLLPLGTMVLTPTFGNLYDRKGKGASIMILGSLLLIFVHVMFSIPVFNHWLFAIFLIIILGIGFSLVPSAMWPSVPKIIPEKQLGTAYSMIFWVQNWGLMGVPALIGWVLDKYCVTGTKVVAGQTIVSYDYTLPMMIFTSLGVLALIFAFLLKAEDKKKGYGLELPNIQK
jgi:MFS family permease